MYCTYNNKAANKEREIVHEIDVFLPDGHIYQQLFRSNQFCLLLIGSKKRKKSNGHGSATKSGRRLIYYVNFFIRVYDYCFLSLFLSPSLPSIV